MFSFYIVQITLKFVSISIIIATAIIVVMKLCNKTLREHDDGRAARGSTVDKYSKIFGNVRYQRRTFRRIPYIIPNLKISNAQNPEKLKIPTSSKSRQTQNPDKLKIPNTQNPD
jgi:hypothetical protein